ncbi:MAG: hypothetical protein WBC63_09045 [Candidatus Bipolaricaulia bacterium]
MAENGESGSRKTRNVLAYSVLGISAAGILALAGVAVGSKSADAKEIFNIVLPVFATWVGTVLAFYFGRENFESANREVREMVDKLTPSRSQASVSSIMRPFQETTHLTIHEGQSERDILLSGLRGQLAGEISRLPIVDSGNRPKYMIHESSLDKYVSTGGSEEHTLETFIEEQKAAGRQFGPGKAFVVVAEDASIAEAKLKMDRVPFCQDIFVTAKGAADEPLMGWVSNLRLAESLKA